MLSRVRFSLALSTILFAAFLAPGAAHGQLGIYGMGSGGFLGSANAAPGSLLLQDSGFSAYGGTFGVYDEFLHLGPVKLGSDVRYFQQTSSNGNSYGNKLRGVTAGVRLALKLPVFPLKPYIQAELGDIATNYGVQPNQTNSFAYQIQGGADYTLLPHLDLRAEYGGGQISAYSTGPKQTVQQAGLGLVVRF